MLIDVYVISLIKKRPLHENYGNVKKLVMYIWDENCDFAQKASCFHEEQRMELKVSILVEESP
jgi:hypothetical protein